VAPVARSAPLCRNCGPSGLIDKVAFVIAAGWGVDDRFMQSSSTAFLVMNHRLQRSVGQRCLDPLHHWAGNWVVLAFLLTEVVIGAVGVSFDGCRAGLGDCFQTTTFYDRALQAR